MKQLLTSFDFLVIKDVDIPFCDGLCFICKDYNTAKIDVGV
jgi:hypothetical protein